MLYSSCSSQIENQDNFEDVMFDAEADEENKENESKVTPKKSNKKRIIIVTIIAACFLLFLVIVNNYADEQLNNTIPGRLFRFYDSGGNMSYYQEAEEKTEKIGWMKIFLLPKYVEQMEAFEYYFDNFSYDRVVEVKLSECEDVESVYQEYIRTVDKVRGVLMGDIPFSERRFWLDSYYEIKDECKKALAVVLECDEDFILIETESDVLLLENITSQNDLPSGLIRNAIGLGFVVMEPGDTVKSIYDYYESGGGNLISIDDLKSAVMFEETYDISDWLFVIDEDANYDNADFWRERMENSYGHYNYK